MRHWRFVSKQRRAELIAEEERERLRLRESSPSWQLVNELLSSSEDGPRGRRSRVFSVGDETDVRFDKEYMRSPDTQTMGDEPDAQERSQQTEKRDEKVEKEQQQSGQDVKGHSGDTALSRRVVERLQHLRKHIKNQVIPLSPFIFQSVISQY